MKRAKYARKILFFILFITTISGISQISISAEASKISGVGPLGVFFDATGTTGTFTNRPFHELRYKWDFGDAVSGNWRSTGKSRNIATGPVAAHVYTQPGAYTATLTVTDANGNHSAEEKANNRRVEFIKLYYQI